VECERLRARAACVSPCDSQTYNGLKDRFIATLGQEPEKELTCVIVPLCTENWLRFSARVDDVTRTVRFELVDAS
jgi:hypothetical protein